MEPKRIVTNRGWIDAKDHPPKPHRRVQVYIKHNPDVYHNPDDKWRRIEIGMRCGGEHQEWHIDANKDAINYRVLYWMPLPVAPKEN